MDERRRADLPARGPRRARLRRLAGRARARLRRPPRRACCPRSRRWSRSCSSGAWSRRSSPPRPSRWASTCRRARSCSRSWSKWNGETHADITPGEYTQLTGRAGRRGIDVEGHAVVRVARRASTRGRWPAWPRPAPTRCARRSGRRTTWPSTSSASSAGTPRASCSRPRSRSSRPTARSWAWPRRSASNEEALDGYREAMTCHLGDFEEYAELRRQLTDREKELARARCRRATADGRRSSRSAALQARRRHRRAGRSPRRRSRSCSTPASASRRRATPDRARPLDRQVQAAVRRRLPAPRSSRSRACASPRTFNAALGQLAARPRRHAARDGRRPARRPAPAQGAPRHRRRRGAARTCARRMRQHPCHGCDEREDHARWAERYHRLRAGDRRRCERRVENRTNSIARQFDRVCDVLAALGYLTPGTTRHGDRRGRHAAAGSTPRCDLLAAECLRRGLWDGPDAGRSWRPCASALVFESRQPDDAMPPRLPGGRGARRASHQLQRLLGPRSTSSRRDHRLSLPARARPRLRLGGLPLGVGAAPGVGAARGRPDRRRLRPLVQAAHRPARSDRPAPPERRRRGARQRTARAAVDAMRARRRGRTRPSV